MNSFFWGAWAAFIAVNLLAIALILGGLFPRYTDTCPNGRRVYMQDGHQQDKEALCQVLSR